MIGLVNMYPPVHDWVIEPAWLAKVKLNVPKCSQQEEVTILDPKGFRRYNKARMSWRSRSLELIDCVRLPDHLQQLSCELDLCCWQRA